MYATAACPYCSRRQSLPDKHLRLLRRLHLFTGAVCSRCWLCFAISAYHLSAACQINFILSFPVSTATTNAVALLPVGFHRPNATAPLHMRRLPGLYRTDTGFARPQRGNGGILRAAPSMICRRKTTAAPKLLLLGPRSSLSACPFKTLLHQVGAQ